MCSFHSFQQSELPRGTRLISSGIIGWHVNLDAAHEAVPRQECCTCGAGILWESSHWWCQQSSEGVEKGLLCCASLVLLQPPFPPAFPSSVPHLAWFILLSKQVNQLLLLEWHESCLIVSTPISIAPPRLGKAGWRWQKAHPDPSAVPCQTSGSCSKCEGARDFAEMVKRIFNLRRTIYFP